MTIAEKILRAKTDYEEVYAAGQAAGGGVDAGLDLFWETYQQGGKRTSYTDSYGYGYFTDETFKPKYTLWANASFDQFRESKITNYEALKMVDFSKVQLWMDYFRSSKMKHLPVIDTRGAYGAGGNLYQTFYGASIEIIDKIILKDDGKQTFENAFTTASLASITFEGVIGNNISFDRCSNLTRDSIMSVISCLQDFSGTTTTKTLTLHATAKARLSEEDIAIATQKGWTLA